MSQIVTAANDNAPTKWAYYNEFDPYAAQWLRNLIKAGHIADGVVDERSILDVNAGDLKGFTQCHFFAGIGGWSLAARLAGWPDDRPLWTGSCPCQPFSVAGKGKGQDDERHLWPVFFDLIREVRPTVVMGEQVAAAVGKSWLDGVFTDLESIGYATGAAVVPACAVNAPHRRDRLWFVTDCLGNTEHDGQPPASVAGCHAQTIQYIAEGQNSTEQLTGAGISGNVSDIALAYAHDKRGDRQRTCTKQAGRNVVAINSGRPLANTDSNGCKTRSITPAPSRYGCPVDTESGAVRGYVANAQCIGQSGQGKLARSISSKTSGNRQADRADDDCARPFWHGAEYLTGPDGKARRIEPSIRLLAHGVPARVGKLRAYGNAIVPQVAAEIIRSYMDCTPPPPH